MIDDRAERFCRTHLLSGGAASWISAIGLRARCVNQRGMKKILFFFFACAFISTGTVAISGIDRAHADAATQSSAHVVVEPNILVTHDIDQPHTETSLAADPRNADAQLELARKNSCWRHPNNSST